MLDDIVTGLIGASIADAVENRTIKGRARRKARRFLAGQQIEFRAHLRTAGQGQQRGRLRVTPGSELATWTPWPRRGRDERQVTLLGGPGVPNELKWRTGSVNARGWEVRVGKGVATLLLEPNYIAAYGPILSLGARES